MAARLDRNGDAWVVVCPLHGELLTADERFSAGVAAARHAACPDGEELAAQLLVSRRDLHSFLLERFAEDEARPYEVPRNDVDEQRAPHHTLHAKRRLVELASEFFSDDPSLHDAIHQVCRMLAAPYANHPEFRGEWAT